MIRKIIPLFLLMTSIGCGGGIELVNQPNSKPEAQDDRLEMDEDTVLNIALVLSNDSDSDGDRLSLAAHSEPLFGSIVLNEQDEFEYHPAMNFSGEDSFEYTLSDGHGGTASAKVTVTVRNINDAPEFTEVPVSIGPADVGAAISLQDKGALLDADDDQLEFEIIATPSGGTVTFSNSGQMRYIPNPGFRGNDSFTLRVSDSEHSVEGTIYLAVGNINNPPSLEDDHVTVQRADKVIFNVLDNDTDPNNDELSVAAWDSPEKGTLYYLGQGQFEYTPLTDADSGSDSFQYTVSDGRGGINTANVYLEIATGWGKLSNHSLFSTFSEQIIDDNGNITLVWTQLNKLNRHQLWSRRYEENTQSWQESVRMDNSESGTNFRQIDLRLDDAGNIVLSWLVDEGSTSKIYANRFTIGDGWYQSPTVVSNIADGNGIGTANNFLVASDSLGNVSYAWYQDINGGYDLLHAHYNAAIDSWLTAQRISLNLGNPDNTARLSVSNGYVALGWIQNNITRSQFYIPGVNEWSQSGGDPLSTTGNVASNLQILQDGVGNIHAVWVETTSTPAPAGLKLRSMDTTSNTWSVVHSVSSTSAAVSNIQLVPLMTQDDAISSDLFIVWQEGNQLKLNASRLGNPWDNTLTKTLSSATQTGAISDIRFIQNGDSIVAVWQQLDNAPGSTHLWSNNFIFNDKDEPKLGIGSLSGEAVKLNGSNVGLISEFSAYSDNRGQITAAWIHEVESNGSTIPSVYSNQFTNNSNWNVNPVVVSEDGLEIQNTLGAPVNLQLQLRESGEAIAVWEHELITDTQRLQVWSNQFDAVNWAAPQKVSDTDSLANHLQHFSMDDNGRFLLLWSSFDGESDHLYARDFSSFQDGWSNRAQLQVGEQYDLVLEAVLYNHEQNPSVFGQDQLINSNSSRLWTIDFR